jgi:uncharacterized membrane protein
MATVATAAAPAERLTSIDIVRGTVMVLMAIDHVRVFSGLPSGGPSPGIFFTRWVTHFCAPVFFFLAGTSAYLYGQRHRDLRRFLLTRGAWLIVLELTVLRLSWTFNLDYAHYMLAGVIWALGWSFIVLAALVKLPVGIVGVVGVATIALHNVLDAFMPSLMPSIAASRLGWLWKLLYVGFFAGPIAVGPSGPVLVVLYTLIPWAGVMAAGYTFGTVMTFDRARRRRACLAIGLGSIALFVVLRGFNLYGDPRPWTPPGSGGAQAQLPTLLAFLNTTKYPASLDFLLMTLGPAVAVLPALERASGPVARALTVFGRVPFFFYVLHIPLIHVLALGVSKLKLGFVDPWLFANHPMGNPPAPPEFVWSLPLLYIVWAVTVVLLYAACRWFVRVKARRRDWWLRYV